MREAQPQKLYLVDPWTKLGEHYNWGQGEDVPYTNYNKLTTLEAKTDAMHRLRNFGDRVTFVEDYELNFCNQFEGKLDFVHIDSSHFYEDTLKAFFTIDRVLADDGFIIGDDWYTDANHYSGVCRAAKDFVRQRDFEITIAGVDCQFCMRRTPHYRGHRTRASAWCEMLAQSRNVPF